ncbi:MAG: TIGR03067 domain-containing protein [Planctomycetota bacterium]
MMYHMRNLYIGFLFVGVLLTAVVARAFADEAQDEAIKKDRKLIEGTWRVVALEIDGNKSMEEDARKITVVNGSDGTWSLRSEGNEICKGTSTIDPAKKPKTIDFTVTEGEGKGNQYPGIYELGEKTRKLCFAPPGNARPTEFSSSPGSEHILVTLEREKSK